MVVLILVTGVSALYAALLWRYALLWKNIPVFEPPAEIIPQKITVIIPARNEKENIGRLLQSLRQQHYPKELTEIIVADDHSSDGTDEEVKKFPGVRLLNLTAEPGTAHKKKAIAAAIREAKGERIVCTDADCVAGPEWIRTLVSFSAINHSVFLAGPVLMEDDSRWFQMFQSMDFMMLQAVTGVAVHYQMLTLSNGANISYTKEAFDSVNGFEGIDHIASGDDMLLMYKIWKRYPAGVHYVKSPQAIVKTKPQPDLKSFIQQRIRWASKAFHYRDKRLFPVIFLVFLMNISIPALLVAGIFEKHFFKYALFLFVAKILAEFPLFYLAAEFFRKKKAALWFPFFQPLHILYTVGIAFASLAGRYEWKGRKVK
ncbi:MAG: glycosyltransferase [Chitinophagaceae bacterium]|nr:glycosyltransferase [Chitinophagaceae bacterium]